MKYILFTALGLLVAVPVFAATVKGIALVESNQQYPGLTIIKYHDSNNNVDCYVVPATQTANASISCVK